MQRDYARDSNQENAVTRMRLDVRNTLRVLLSTTTTIWDHLAAEKQAQGNH